MENILDVGAGIRPQPFFKAKSHLCVEPHGEYADRLEAEGYPVLRTTAKYALGLIGRVDTVFLLDVIEHMIKPEGLDVLKLAAAKVRHQVVVYTPLGFRKQHYRPDAKDAWGLTGIHWQTHRSGWTPEEFPGWEIISKDDSEGFFAIFTHPALLG